MNNCISKKDTKAVYKDGNTVRKVFAPDYSKTDVLYEALNTARVEDTGLDIPKILSVSVEDGQWVITSEYAKGVTLTQLIKEHPENIDSYVHAMVDYQIAFNKRSNPLLLKLKDKLVRQINELELDSNIKYELSPSLLSFSMRAGLAKLTVTGWNRCQSTTSSATATTARTISLLKRTMPERLPLSLPLTGFMPHRAMPVPMLPTHI